MRPRTIGRDQPTQNRGKPCAGIICGTYSTSEPHAGANSLSYLEPGRGYMVRMKESAVLTVEGWRLPVGTPIWMDAGWHWIGYLPEVGQKLPGALASIEGSYGYLLGETGTYAPPPALSYLNTLTRMEPGEGYLIRMAAEATLVHGGGSP